MEQPHAGLDGYFGASTRAAVALNAAATFGGSVGAVVSGGWSDMAVPALRMLKHRRC